MSFLSRLLARNDTEQRTVTNLESVPNWVMESQGGTSEIKGNPKNVGAFYACVTLLADTISSLTATAYRQQNQARIEVTPQPGLLMADPYPGLTWFDWLWMMVDSLAVTGNAFGLVTARDNQNRPTAILPIHPDAITINQPKPGEEEETNWIKPVYRIGGKKQSSSDIVHIKRFPIAGRPWGMSPIEHAAGDLGLSLEANRYGLRWFRDSAHPSGILSAEGDLTPEQTLRTQKQWAQTHGAGRRMPAVMSGGMKWTPISITPNESQFLETREFQRSEIAMWFRIPPHMIGDTAKSTSWGTGIEQQSIGFATYTLRPWLTCIEQALGKYIPRGQFIKFNIDGLLRGDVKARWEAYRLGREAGVYSVNDIRAMEDLPPVEDGDGRLQPMNFAPLGYEPPPEPTGPTPNPVRFEPSPTQNADYGEED